jgi:hypothetical protein
MGHTMLERSWSRDRSGTGDGSGSRNRGGTGGGDVDCGRSGDCNGDGRLCIAIGWSETDVKTTQQGIKASSDISLIVARTTAAMSLGRPVLDRVLEVTASEAAWMGSNDEDICGRLCNGWRSNRNGDGGVGGVKLWSQMRWEGTHRDRRDCPSDGVRNYPSDELNGECQLRE